jgi:2-polyprenyl-3-methyl-5-hydroxy-6-metoxy-1,4-benzoquinol methylase
MHPQDDVVRLLKGEGFSSGIQMPVAHRERKLVTRMDFIETMVKNRKIIHLGCADHVQSIQKKLARNKWFHKRLADCAERCLGVDISREGLEIMRRLGYEDVLLADLARDPLPAEIGSVRWDYMVMGEIVEHQDNPVAFLDAVRRKCRGVVDRFVVSAPNAFRLNNFTSALKNLEKINSDHRYWFTPYTLAKVGVRAGLEIEHFQMCQSFPPAPYQIFQRILLTRVPGLRDDVVMVFKVE